MKRMLLLFTLIMLSFSLSVDAIGGGLNGKILLVCSGAGLMKPLNQIISEFKKKTGVNVQVHYGGSGEIFGILETVCSCDVFIPGAYKYTKDAMSRGYILRGTVRKMVLHVPVIAVPYSNPAHIRSLKDLAKPGVKVALGDPRACAIGRVSMKIFRKNRLLKGVKKNVIVYAPTVNQLLMYVATGEVEAAIVWEDATKWAKSRKKMKIIEIPKRQNLIKTIPTAVTVCAKKDGHINAAKAFNRFVSESRSIHIWEKWGFKPCK